MSEKLNNRIDAVPDKKEQASRRIEADLPNATTIAAIEEGRRLARDPSAPSYSTMEELKAALEE